MVKRRRNLLSCMAAAGTAAGTAVATATTVYLLAVRPRILTWGATAEELALRLPGDELVRHPKIDVTHAVTIDAPPAKVWPWLVQIGQGRGGFYSYEWLENMMGLDIRNADRILPEHQQLQVGDTIPLAPDNFDLPVAILEPERALVLHGDTRTAAPGQAPPMRPGDYLVTRWGFYLRPLPDGRTRLIERWAADFAPNWFNRVAYGIFLEPGAFLMERKMLLGIKERAERME
jgi:hypothetical protein